MALKSMERVGPVDEHVVFVHFGGVSVGRVVVILMGALEAVRQRVCRFASWSTGLVAAFIWLVSVGTSVSSSNLCPTATLLGKGG